MKPLLLFIQLGILLGHFSTPAEAAYSYNRSITIAHGQCGTADSSNFPVLVKLDSGSAGTTMKVAGSGGHIQHSGNSASGPTVTMPYDLIFTSDSGGTTKIPWEVESYDGAAGTLLAWVKTTCNHTTDQVIYVFYGDSGVNTAQNTGSFTPANVWDSNYKTVLHMADNAARWVFTSLR